MRQFQDIKETARNQLEAYLRQKGIDTRKPFTCLNPAHEDRHPSMRYDPRRLRVHCFACGADHDVFGVLGLEYGLASFAQQFQRACELFELNPVPVRLSTSPQELQKGNAAFSLQGKNPESIAAYCLTAQTRINDTAYPQERGLSREILHRFGVGFDPAFPADADTLWRALILPTGPESFTARNIDPTAHRRERIRKRGPSVIFNGEALYTADRPVFVVEGELDALSVIDVGGEAVALGSTTNVPRFLRMVDERAPVQPLILSMDNDAQGQRAADVLADALQVRAIPHYRGNMPIEHKDASEALQADREAFTALVEGLSLLDLQADISGCEEYLHTSIAHHLKGFLSGISESVNTHYVPTGFAALDDCLDGGLFEGLYILGAITSLGKTTFVLQIADQIAAGGQDVLLFSLEMARNELIAKSISRHTLLLAQARGEPMAHAKTVRGITVGVRYAGYTSLETALIEDAVRAYGAYAEHLFVSEGVGEIGVEQVRAGVAQHIEYTGRRPVVIVDYLQILSPANARATDKQNMDRAVLELKRISRDHKTPVIAVSSFNRAGYREVVTMEAFKESGAIEYSSDVLMGLQLQGAGGRDFDIIAQRAQNPRAVELIVLKNRNGASGSRLRFSYYPMFNYFSEA